MKPKRIILVRHGKSEGNADRMVYETIPDYALNLTPLGIQQAREAGSEITQIIGDESLRVYCSPYYRTRQTCQYILESVAPQVDAVLEDPRLREQDWGHQRPLDDIDEIIKSRDAFSTFYFRIPDGESGADVYDRMSTFFESLHRDFIANDFPQNALIVTHGMTLRLFLMRWFHWRVEDFEKVHNPQNCQVVVLEMQENGKYKLVSELRRRK